MDRDSLLIVCAKNYSYSAILKCVTGVRLLATDCKYWRMHCANPDCKITDAL